MKYGPSNVLLHGRVWLCLTVKISKAQGGKRTYQLQKSIHSYSPEIHDEPRAINTHENRRSEGLDGLKTQTPLASTFAQCERCWKFVPEDTEAAFSQMITGTKWDVVHSCWRTPGLLPQPHHSDEFKHKEPFLLPSMVCQQVTSCSGKAWAGTASWWSCVSQGNAAASILPMLLPPVLLWVLPSSMKGVGLHCCFSFSRDQDIRVEGFVSGLLQLAKTTTTNDSSRMGSSVRKQLRNLSHSHNFEGLDNKLTEKREKWEEVVFLLPLTGNPF